MRVAVFGASGGIGGALADALAKRGEVETLFALSRRGEAGPPGGQALRCDLLDEASIAAAAAQIGRLDLCLVATGVLEVGLDHGRRAGPEKTIRAVTPEAMLSSFAVNAVGPALVAKHVIPQFGRRERAVFAALSARVGSITDNRLGGWHSYRASKAALNQIVRTIAVELARTHPLAVAAALHPGTVATSLSAPYERGVAPERLFSPERAAGHLLDVIDGLTPADSGKLIAWDGTPIPY